MTSKERDDIIAKAKDGILRTTTTSDILKLADIKDGDENIRILTASHDFDYEVHMNLNNGISLMLRTYPDEDYSTLINVFDNRITTEEEIKARLAYRKIEDMIDLLYANKYLYDQLEKKDFKK